jgi:hypothetical protein
MQVPMTPNAEALLDRIMALGDATPEIIVESALQLLHDQSMIDTTLGFDQQSEAAIIQENQRRWANFEASGHSISHEQMINWADRLAQGKQP